MPKPIITPEQESQWRTRECENFADGTYVEVPWAAEPWFCGSVERLNHYLHVSDDDPSKVAFTPDSIKGVADRQTRMKPGRYLTRFFIKDLSCDEIAEWAGKFAGENEELTVNFATTPDDIETVYDNGPRSCMSGKACVRTYGAGDLAVAYLGAEDDVSARVVCWPAKKVYSVIYGDSARLAPALKNLGFTGARGGEFEGARLLYIEDGGGFLAPYFDGSEGASVKRIDGETFLVLQKYGEHSLNNTEGMVGGATCDHCDEAYDPENEGSSVGDEIWCESCYDNYAFCCENCEESSEQEGARNITNERGHEAWWCEHCADNSAYCCGGCNNFFETTTTIGDGSERCESCLEELSCCEHCEEWSDAIHSTVKIGTNEESWCESCTDSDATQCGRCDADDDIYQDSEISQVGGETLCEDCATEKRDEIDETLEAIGASDCGTALLLLPAFASSQIGAPC